MQNSACIHPNVPDRTPLFPKTVESKNPIKKSRAHTVVDKRNSFFMFPARIDLLMKINSIHDWYLKYCWKYGSKFMIAHILLNVFLF